MPRTRGEKQVLISVHLPREWLEALEALVRRGVFPHRSEAIRHAIRELLDKYRDMATYVEIDEDEMDIELMRGR